MIAAWMLYTIVVTVILFAAASPAEYVARALRAPMRFVWVMAMVAAVGLSARALLVGRDTSSSGTTFAPTVPSFHIHASTADTVVRSTVVAPTSTGRLDRLLMAARSAANSVTTTVRRIDVSSLEQWNRALLVAWIASSLLVVAWFAGSLLRLRLIARGLTPATVGNHAVLVSKDVGPGLFGILRSHILIPRWVLELPTAERDIILAHERQHAAAFDPALMFAGACLVALQPWNVALWALLARLRLALEADCDRRVVGETGDARDYGRLLIAIYERTTPGLSPYVAFTGRQSNLERRIRRITRRPRLVSAAVGSSAVVAIVLATAAWTTSAPIRSASVRTVQPPVTPVPVAPVPIVPSPKDDIAQPVMRLGRCSLVEHTEPNCSIYGEVIVTTFDSTHVIVSARDTSDAGLGATDILILAMRNGTVPSGLGWYTKAGRATRTDSVVYYAGPGQSTLAFRFHPGATIRERGARVIDVKNTMATIQSSVMTWDFLREFPTAPRCIPRSRRDACVLVGGTQRMEFPIP